MRSQMKNYLRVIACLFVLFSTVHAAMPVDTSDYLIAGSHDGNLHDHDDYLATALALGFLGEAGMQDKVVHWDYSNHLGNNNSTMNNDMIISTEDGADKFGFSPAGRFNDDAFFNCQNELSAGIANFVAVSELLGPDLYLYYCCAGPMEVPWRMLNAVKDNDASKLNYIVCISHSNWNENHTHDTQLSHTWNDMVDDFGGIGVAFHRIVDQNSCGGTNDFNSPESKWNWLCSSGIPEWEWICTRDDKADFDASDAGMYMYVISGEAQTGKDTHRGGPETGANRYNGDSCASVQDCQWLFEEYDPITDEDTPTPNPAQWAVVPVEIDDNTITMTAEEGTDTESPPVEYYFTVTSGDCLSTDSGWQYDDPTFTIDGLAPGREYCFTVKMRDQAGNETAESTIECATTTGTEDLTAPGPADFDVYPIALSSSEITMTAIERTDLNGPVEYNFVETSHHSGGSDSGWQTSRTYTDDGLEEGTSYSYAVQLRDVVCNEGVLSDFFGACTRPDVDIVDDGIIDILDLRAMAAQWLEANCCLLALCQGTDLDASGTVDMGDFSVLAAQWQELLGPSEVTLEYSPTDDAYLQGTTRYNTADLRTEEDNRITYIKFVVSDVPGAYSVSSAVLTLTEGNDPGNGTFTCYSGTATDWTETTLSGANAPVQIAELDQHVGDIINGQAVDFDVSSYVTGDGVYHFIITHASGNDVSWQSKENSAGAGPLLTITAER